MPDDLGADLDQPVPQRGQRPVLDLVWQRQGARGAGVAMIGPAPGTRIFLACGHTDMRRGMDGLAALVQQSFGADRCGRCMG